MRKFPSSSLIKNQILSPHFRMTKTPRPLLSRWNHVHAPLVAAVPQRMSEVGGTMPLPATRRARRSVENLGGGSKDASPIGNCKAFNIFPSGACAASRSWPVVAVVSHNSPAPASPTRTDWSTYVREHS